MIDSSSQVPISPPSSRRWKLQIPIRLSRQSTTSQQHQSPRRGVSLTFCNRTKNYDDEEEEKKEEIDENGDNTTSFEIESLPILMMPSSSMTTVTTTARTENVDPSDDCCSVLVEPPSFTNFSSFQILSPIIKHQCLDHRDDSFRTEATVSDELSLSDEDNSSTNGNPDISFPPSSDSSSSSSSDSIDENEEKTQNSASFQSNGAVRFADEIGLPMEHVLHYKCDREQREHSELLVLCICPKQKKFEFLHVGYHRQENNNDDDDDEKEDDDEDDDDNVIEILTNPTTMNATKIANVQDLLQGLPKMCTDSIFGNSTFDAIYRNNGVDKFFQKLEDWSIPLPECGLRENELVVVAIKGSSERDVLEGIGPILSNDRIMKTLKRGRRSRRSLKFVRNSRRRVKQQWRRLKLPSSSSSSRKTMSGRKGITTKKSDANDFSSACSSTGSKIDASIIDSACSSSNDDLVDVYCHDYDPFNGISESKEGQLLLAFITILVGTVILSAFGL